MRPDRIHCTAVSVAMNGLGWVKTFELKGPSFRFCNPTLADVLKMLHSQLEHQQKAHLVSIGHFILA